MRSAALSVEHGFAHVRGRVITREAAERYVDLDDRVPYEYALDAGYQTFKPPIGWVVDMDRDRYGNTIPADQDRAEREGWWCP